MNKSLRLKIEESVETKQVSENLCFLCLACLNEKITYSKQSIDGYGYIKWRELIAKVAIANGIDKSLIVEKIRSISKDDYPTFKAIERVYNMLIPGNYIFISGFIPDRMIHYKTPELMQADLARKPTVRKQNIEAENLHEIISYIRTAFDINKSSISDDIITKRIKKIATREYSFDVILQALKWNDAEIKKIIAQKHFNNVYDRLCYIIGILKNHLRNTQIRIQQKENELIQFWNSNASLILDGIYSLEKSISIQCDDTNSANYRKHDYVRQQLMNGMERVKVERQQQKHEEEIDVPLEIDTYTRAEYQRKTGKCLSELEELWYTGNNYQRKSSDKKLSERLSKLW